MITLHTLGCDVIGIRRPNDGGLMSVYRRSDNTSQVLPSITMFPIITWQQTAQQMESDLPAEPREFYYILKFLFIYLCITILASLHNINFVYLPKLENTITCARAARTNIRLDFTNPGLTCPMQCKDLHVNNQRTHSAFLRGLLAGVIERLHFTYSNSRGCP